MSIGPQANKAVPEAKDRTKDTAVCWVTVAQIMTKI